MESHCGRSAAADRDADDAAADDAVEALAGAAFVSGVATGACACGCACTHRCWCFCLGRWATLVAMLTGDADADARRGRRRLAAAAAAGVGARVVRGAAAQKNALSLRNEGEDGGETRCGERAAQRGCGRSSGEGTWTKNRTSLRGRIAGERDEI